MSRYRNCIILILISYVLLSMSACVFPNASSPAAESPSESSPQELLKLSALSDEELLGFIKRNIPYYGVEEEVDQILLTVLKGIATSYDKDSSFGSWGLNSYTKTVRCGEDLSEAVKRYYAGLDPAWAWEEKPIQNTFIELPKDWYTKTGYKFVIGKGLIPGFSLQGSIPERVQERSLETLADYTKQDLQSYYLCQYCVRVTSERPAYSELSEDETAICIRKGADPSGNQAVHLMRLTDEGWVHQLDYFGVMEFVGEPDESTDWVSEGTYDGVHWFRSDTVFTGPICYIIYKSNHSGSFEYTGWHNHDDQYHSYRFTGSCPDCGASSYWEYYPRKDAACPDSPPSHGE
ncbi:MAG: hypothetical protein J5794_01080 [Lachnospiraceae bacterium]|nr:hypothetical protein [Lachnospiraceae bacterium]